MNMPIYKKVYVFAAIAVLASSSFAFADLPEGIKGPRGGGVRASTANQTVANMANEVARVSALEQGSSISNASYNQNGTLDQVTYADGTKTSYSYQTDSDGKITKCTVATDKAAVTFVSGKSGVVEKIFVADKRSGRDSEPLVVINVTKDGPTAYDVSHKPASYEFISRIENALDGMENEKRFARAEYQKNSSAYYDRVENSLAVNKKALAASGIDVSSFITDVGKPGIKAEEKRRIIDEAVNYVRSEAAKDATGESAKDFMMVEKAAREEVLDPAMAIYEGKIEKALAYLYSIIESLMQSKLVLYMDTAKERIDAIINLPEIKKATTESPKALKK